MKIGDNIETMTLKDFLSQAKAEEINIFKTRRVIKRAVKEGRLDANSGERLEEILSRPGEIGAVFERPRRHQQARPEQSGREDLGFLFSSPKFFGH